MSAGPERCCPETERVALYALGALDAAEARILEAHLAVCDLCRSENSALRSVVDGFAHWPTDVLRASHAPWDRVTKRLAEETRQPILPAPERWEEPQWQEVAPGIRCKLLANDAENGRVSMLVRLAPGVHYPPHRHAGVEELHLLDGELWIGDRKLRPGDYNRGEPRAVDSRVWSETGCTCVLVTSSSDEIL